MVKIEEILEEYGLGVLRSTENLKGGIVNQSQKVVTSKGKFVIQQLSPMFTPAVIDDYCQVQSYLRTNWLRVPVLLNTTQNKRYVERDGRIWRAFEYIPSDPLPDNLIDLPATEDVIFEAGKMLGKFHKLMAESDFVPTHKLKGFHDFDAYVREFKSKSPTAENSNEYKLLARNISRFAEQRFPPVIRLIHGDPKIANMLFEDGRAIALLDLDTMMFGDEDIDIGDALRSCCKPHWNPFTFIEWVRGYKKGNPGSKSMENYKRPQFAMQKMTFELALRFFNDSYDQKYFSWDPKRYLSAAEHNLACCREYIDYYISLGDAL